jgi:hypothetical protein
MVMKEHGIDSLPNGDELRDLDVGSLNEWLNNTPDGDWRNGATSWTALMRLSSIMHASDSAYPELEYKKIIPIDLEEIDRILTEEKRPLIFEERQPQSPSGRHFVVANGVKTLGWEYYIHDPWDEDRNLISTSSSELISARYLYPNNTNLSYLILHADEKLLPLIINPEASQSGIINGTKQNDIENASFSLDYPIYNEFNPLQTTGGPFWEFSSPDPTNGQYRLKFSTDQPGWSNFEIYAYDSDANVKVFREIMLANSKYPTRFNLDYFQDGDENFATLKKLTTYKTLKKDLQLMRKLGYINNRKGRVLSLFVRIASRFSGTRHQRFSHYFLDKFEKGLVKFHPKFMDDKAYEYLLQELELLKSSL